MLHQVTSELKVGKIGFPWKEVKAATTSLSIDMIEHEVIKDCKAK